MKVPCLEWAYNISKQQSIVFVVTIFVFFFLIFVVPGLLQNNAFPSNFRHIFLVIFFLFVYGVVFFFQFFRGEGFQSCICFLGASDFGNSGGILFGSLFRFLLGCSSRIRTNAASPLLYCVGIGDCKHRNIFTSLRDGLSSSFSISVIGFVVFHVSFSLLSSFPGHGGTFESLIPAGNGLLQDSSQESIRRSRYDRGHRII
mmetsp:Transcript_8604/g.18572  ORF Transcript_8604/g.18572 Transcript_8604/m.18572 type:complete len:201 (-) Transcript_8604:366-968(-)